MTDPLVRMYMDEIKGAVARRASFDKEFNVIASEVKRLYGDSPTTKIDIKDIAFLITKSSDGGDWLHFSGIASTDDEDTSGDVISPGAFGKSIDPANVALLAFHEPDKPIGKWTKIEQEGRRLHCRGAVLKTLTKGAEAAVMIANGVVNGLSVGFKIKAAVYNKTTGVRTITAAVLHEISIVALPANRAARIVAATKSLQPRPRAALW